MWGSDRKENKRRGRACFSRVVGSTVSGTPAAMRAKPIIIINMIVNKGFNSPRHQSAIF